MKSSTDVIGSAWEASKQRAEPRLPPTPLTVRSAGGAMTQETLDFYVVLFTAVRNERRQDRQSHISGKTLIRMLCERCKILGFLQRTFDFFFFFKQNTQKPL